MITARIMPRGWVGSLVLVVASFGGVAGSAVAQIVVPTSAAYTNVTPGCSTSNCHGNPLATPASGPPPNPQKILLWSSLNVARASAPADMRATAASFGNNMLPSYITGRSDPDLLELYDYLRAVRDGLASATILPFGTITVGQSSAAQMISLGNLRGSAVSYSFSQTNPADYSVTQTPGCSASATSGNIAAAVDASIARVCDLTVTFSPQGTGARDGSLSISLSGASSVPSPAARTVNFTGAGSAPPAPIFTYQPAADLTLSSVVGTTTPKRIGTISNTGNANLTLGTLAFSPATEFAIDTTQCRSNLVLTPAPGAGSSCFVDIQFTPTATGPRQATLSIPNDGPPATLQVQVNGTGLAVPVATIDLQGLTALAFGRVPLGSSSTPQSFTIRNSGTAALTVNSIAFAPAASDFSRTGGNCPSTFPFTLGTTAPSNACTVELSFRPSVAGAATAAQVSVASNAVNGTPAPAVSLSGFGLPNATATPATLQAFPSTLF
ncbi:MAG: choice-of-anchor D domain-containing protein, partial [Ideonella sp.]